VSEIRLDLFHQVVEVGYVGIIRLYRSLGLAGTRGTMVSAVEDVKTRHNGEKAWTGSVIWEVTRTKCDSKSLSGGLR